MATNSGNEKAQETTREGTVISSGEANSDAPTSIELCQKKKQEAAIAVGFWQKRVLLYRKLLHCCEDELESAKAELKAAEEIVEGHGKSFPAPEAHAVNSTDHLTPGRLTQATRTISSPNLVTGIVENMEDRLARLTAISTPARVTLFGSINDEKKALAEIIVTNTSIAETTGGIPDMEASAMDTPLESPEGLVISAGNVSIDRGMQANTSSGTNGSSPSRPQPVQQEALGDGGYEPDHGTIRRGYDGSLPRGCFTRGRARRAMRGNYSRGATTPSGSSSTPRPAANLVASKRTRAAQGGTDSDTASDYQPERDSKRKKQVRNAGRGHSQRSDKPPEILQRQSLAAAGGRTFGSPMSGLEGAVTFSRANISSAFGGAPHRAWVQTGKGGNSPYRVDQYLCPMRGGNPHLPTNPGSKGYIYAGDRQTMDVGKSYELFIPDDSKEWRYYGKYLVAGTRKATLSEWAALPEAERTWWCKQILQKGWGLQMVLIKELITATEYKTCTIEKVKGFFNMPDGEKNLRLNVLTLAPAGYNRELYQALVESLGRGSESLLA